MKKSTLCGMSLLFGIVVCFLLPATALAQPVFKSIDEDNVRGDDRIFLDAPGNLAAGDFMLVSIALSDDESFTSIPSGWTELTDENISQIRLWVGYKFATQADLGDSFRWDIDRDADIVGQLRVYANVDPVDPINVWSVDDDDTNDIDSPSVTTTRNNTMIVRMFGAEVDNEPDDLTPSHNNEFFEDACDCVEEGVVQGSGDLLQPVAGVSGSASWDNLDEDDWIAVTVALGPTYELATFTVTKDFVPDDSAGVEVFITCNDGLPLNSSQVITEDASGVTFVVENFTPRNMDCEITEDPVPGGYIDSYVAAVAGEAGSIGNTDGCQFNEVYGGDFSCVITNTAMDATFEVNKVWNIIGEGGNLIEQVMGLTISCSEEILNESPSADSGPDWVGGRHVANWLALSGDTTVTVTVDSTNGPANCRASETIISSAVETDNACASNQSLTMGQTTSCTITNTVFFEGIPTLNRYGLALMALLMLGVGLFGFRRFS